MRSATASTSWPDCVARAADDRSRRDLEFFVSTSKLSNPNEWLIRHLHANEQRFCKDISSCEKVFDRVYAQTSGAYPACVGP